MGVWEPLALSSSCFKETLGPKKGGNVDQDIRGRGLVLGKVTSLKDLMIFYLEELLRPMEVRAILESRNNEEGEDWCGFTAVCRTNSSGGKPQGEDFIPALGRRAQDVREWALRPGRAVKGILVVSGSKGGDTLRPLQLQVLGLIHTSSTSFGLVGRGSAF